MDNLLHYQNHSASIRFNTADEVFYGKILGINDLVSFKGSSVKELKTAFEEAVKNYLETCKAAGKPTEKTYKGTFNVRVPAALHKEVAFFAASNNITLNEFVKLALYFTLSQQDKVNLDNGM